MAATTKIGFTYKITDFGPSYPPCDVVHYKNTPAYVIIAYPQFVFVLSIEEIMSCIENDEKTMSQDSANGLALWGIEISKLPK